MRLFLAVNFDGALKDALFHTAQALKEQAAGGNFTRRENFHLTLAFLGEQPDSRVPAVRRAMEATPFSPFDLRFQRLGWFRRSGGDLYWLGAKDCPALMKMQKRLCAELRREGFELETRPFRPHLTLGREVRLPKRFDHAAFEAGLPDLDAHVEKISLMKSERIRGVLTYTELYSCPAGE
ncbi:MAG: RNA 2',3'-cyclic phosphodiesterase [Clostridiales bacterium]|nr:RNA 2',3'-cyclic phosphodiesterase [Clostridiales bacterium]